LGVDTPTSAPNLLVAARIRPRFSADAVRKKRTRRLALSQVCAILEVHLFDTH
jgi:hypothetical protein